MGRADTIRSEGEMVQERSSTLRMAIRVVFTKLLAAIRDRSVWRIIGLGQLISLCICGTGVTSQLLQSYNFSAPLTQLFLTYLTLGVLFGTSLAFRDGGKKFCTALRERGWKFFLLSIIDVEANFAVVKAYQYTTLTSVQLLDGFSIPSVMLFSFCLLRARFKWAHYLGVLVCVVGMATLIVTDYFHNNRDSGEAAKSRHSQAAGDALCLLGALLYAMSNVCEEYFVKRIDISEFLGMLGLFASFVCGIQILAIERDLLDAVDWSAHGTSVALLVVGFAACQLGVYLVMPLAVRHSSAVTINLSILTADLYSLLFGLFLFSFKFSGLYFLAFVLIMTGLIVYTASPVPSSAPPGNVAITSGESAVPVVDSSHVENCTCVGGTQPAGIGVDDTPADGDLDSRPASAIGAGSALASDSDADAARDNQPLIQQPS